MSHSQLNAASCSSIVVKTKAMLPNQPLPPQPMTMAQPPYLRKHPVPSVVSPTSATSITLEQLVMRRDHDINVIFQCLVKQGHSEQFAHHIAQQMGTKRYKPTIDVILQSQQPPKLPVISPNSATTITLVPAPQSTPPIKSALSLLLKKRKHEVLEPQPQSTEQKSKHTYPNLNDIFGCVEHMLKEEKQSLKVIQPPLPSSPSLPSLEQLVLHQDHNMSVIFKYLVKQGHSEQFAIHIAQQMAAERYKPTIDAILQSQQYKQQQNNEQPGSSDYFHRDNSMLFKSDMPTSKRRKLDFDINQVLATEILRKILQKLDIKNLCMARAICKRWKAIIDGFQLVKEASGKILDFALML